LERISESVCIGAPFARTKLVLILAIMARTFRIRLTEPRIVRPTGIVSTQLDDPPTFLLQLGGATSGAAATLCP
jgi:cytochrome P450